ncbi:superoxide dismutase [Kordiimonas aquimaris]|uniref:superoxide dismutase n=1 Tax=Kordiimonas aquimaris TaxID=707591 RepID=UPI0021D32753|nr:superoxide dismutase [Kordiimonas aquimaris]
MPHILPELPYAQTALEPYVSAETLSFHYGKHHNAYVGKLNALIEGTEFEDMSLEDIIKATAGVAAHAGIFNNAAQIWNHTFYWHSMTPDGGGKPTGALAEMIERDFGGYDQFVAAFKDAGATQFGSGWAWLVYKDSKLSVVKTANAECPLTDGVIPLLTMDVWEHAYYLDYQNKRPDYIQVFLDKLVNWSFVEENLSAAK